MFWVRGLWPWGYGCHLSIIIIALEGVCSAVIGGEENDLLHEEKKGHTDL